MYSSIYRVQSSTRRLPIQALFGFTLKQSSPILPSLSESPSVVVCPRFALGHLIQGLERSFLLITKVEYNVLASQIHHGTTNNSIVLNKASVEVAETEEGTDLLDICRLRPLQNSINLFRVHFDPIM